MTTAWTLMPSPVDELLLSTDGDALTGVWFSPHRGSTSRGRDPRNRHDKARRDDSHPLLVEARRQLEAYFAGALRQFDLPVAPVGTPFQQRVWTALADIPYGTTESYGHLAARLGLVPGASRAVGLANGANPVSIVLPCHRVVGSDGSLTGYGGGLERKRFLLELEAGVPSLLA
jgi:methylated-DNA-[protein]-cysteine S-methyltransferase